MNDLPEVIKSPFSQEQIDNLNYSQNCGFVHPYTCGKSDCREVLVATQNGLVCPKCDYKQDWVLCFNVNERPVSPFNIP